MRDLGWSISKNEIEYSLYLYLHFFNSGKKDQKKDQKDQTHRRLNDK